MNNGLFHGGPLDGQVIESDADHYRAREKLEFTPYGNLSSQDISNETCKTFIYKKVWRKRNQHQWYEWRLIR
jgi:hypothetical protein